MAGGGGGLQPQDPAKVVEVKVVKGVRLTPVNAKESVDCHCRGTDVGVNRIPMWV